jgi:hypothetical protein
VKGPREIAGQPERVRAKGGRVGVGFSSEGGRTLPTITSTIKALFGAAAAVYLSGGGEVRVGHDAVENEEAMRVHFTKHSRSAVVVLVTAFVLVTVLVAVLFAALVAAICFAASRE